MNYLPGTYGAGTTLVCAEGLSLSDDGLVAVGKHSPGCGGSVVAADFTTGGVQGLAAAAGATASAAQGVSADGGTIVGWAQLAGRPYAALVWEGGASTEALSMATPRPAGRFRSPTRATARPAARRDWA